jgi:putative ABC transport system permease protein
VEVRPILSSLRRGKPGAILIALQIAVTLAVLSNALFITRQRLRLSRAPSGVTDEASVFIITNQWAGQAGDLAAREKADLASLRALPQVENAIVSVDYPLGGPGFGESITLEPGNPKSGALSAIYPVDDQGIRTLGLNLIAGRNFRPDEIVVRNGFDDPATSLGGVIVTQALARKLVPQGNALGRLVTIVADHTKVPIVGIVKRLEAWPYIPAAYRAQSMLLPYLWVHPQVFYIVRAKRGRLASAMQAARSELYKVSLQRVIVEMQSLADARREAYRGDRAVALIMSVISAILLGITAFGIFGLTSFWVSQRTRQIGIRRALGATRVAILRYFQTENLLISAAGVALGVLLALAGNLWIMRSIALARLPVIYLVVGGFAVLLLGQLAVLWPAMRAAWVPPAVATRNV